MKTILVDIDNTICHTEGNDYLNAKPDYVAIAKINRLYDDGNIVIYWTARGGTTGINWRSETIDQLRAWGCKCTDVRVGKPSFDQFIDDKASSIKIAFPEIDKLAYELYCWSDANGKSIDSIIDCADIINWLIYKLK